MDDTPYEVGKFYMVPCVKIMSGFLSVGSVGEWIPVLLPAHPDPELSFPELHYHIDFRFNRFFSSAMNMVAVLNPTLCSAPEYHRRKCRREQPIFPKATPKARTTFVPFETTYLEKKLDLETMVCPHKRICLKGIKPVDGVITCPGHGLKWNATNGECVPHHTAD
jgi:hypothetical protein